MIQPLNTRFDNNSPDLLATAVLCGVFVYHASKLYVTNDPMSYFRDGRALITETRKIQRDLAGVKVFFITLRSDEEKAFQDPENLQKLVDIQQFLVKQGIFDRSISLADYLSLVNREFHGGADDKFKLPVSRELVAQYLLFFHRSDLDDYVSHDYSPRQHPGKAQRQRFQGPQSTYPRTERRGQAYRRRRHGGFRRW